MLLANVMVTPLIPRFKLAKCPSIPFVVIHEHLRPAHIHFAVWLTASCLGPAKALAKVAIAAFPHSWFGLQLRQQFPTAE
jgi:hypothetical protein